MMILASTRSEAENRRSDQQSAGIGLCIKADGGPCLSRWTASLDCWIKRASAPSVTSTTHVRWPPFS